jgi:NADH-ubiquinone oxidoreductase chain 2
VELSNKDKQVGPCLQSKRNKYKFNLVMITISILILIVAKALPVLNTHISSIHVTRITSIVFLFAGALTLNILNIESIGTGIGIYSGFFQVTTISQLIEIFLFIIGGGILIAWPLFKQTFSFSPLLTQEDYAKSAYFSQPLRMRSTLSQLSEGLPLFKSFGEAGYYVAQGGVTLTTAKAGLLTDKHSTDYSLVVLFSSLGSSLLISSYDLISVYLSIELQSFGLYVLSTLYRDSESSTSAGLKYFLLGGLSSCIILLGTGIIYSYTGTTNLESLYIINSVIDVNQEYIIQGISLGLSLIFIGFLFKIAAAPLHNWSPDVYDGTPTIVTTWLTIIPKIAILFILLEIQVKLGSFGPIGDGLNSIILNSSGNAGLLRINLNQGVLNETVALIGEGDSFAGLLAQGGSNSILKTLLLISSTLSLIIGSLLGLAQIRIKRLLAYSTISHIGFILLALAVNTEQSIDSFIFYIIQYTITNLNIFLVILGISYCLFRSNPQLGLETTPLDPSLKARCNAGWGVLRRATPVQHHMRSREETAISIVSTEVANKDISFISEFKGLFFSNPLLSISLAVSLFSMAGIPPLIGFFSKQLVLYSALQNGYYFISILAIIVSVISCSYYLQIIKVLFTHSSPPHAEHLTLGSPTPPQDQPNSYFTLTTAKAGTTPCASLALWQGEGTTPYASLALWQGEGTTPSLGEGTTPCLGEGTPSEWSCGEINLTNTHSYLISTLTFTILLFFIKPSLILNSTQLLSLSLFYI